MIQKTTTVTESSENSLDKSALNPWYFIPSLYFAEGLPYILINAVSVIIYKRMEVGNAEIAFWTSLLYLPWVIKMLWAPIVDLYSTTKKWVIASQIAMFGCLSLAAISLFLPNFFFISLIAFTIGAFISATQDIAIDGFYLQALNEKEQDIFAGIRPIFYRMAVIFGSGFLVFFAGKLENDLGNIPLSWSIALGLSAFIFVVFSVYHQQILAESKKPETKKNKLVVKPTSVKNFLKIIFSYFRKPKIIAIIVFILLFRFGEALLIKLTSPFLLDAIEKGGLGLSTEQVGLVYGTVGVLSLIIGGVLGGLIIAIYGLKFTILPMALALNIPNLFYVYMAIFKPSFSVVFLSVALEQFGSGIGLTAFMVYLIKISAGKYKTSYYAISTGIMALGMMVPGLISGYLQEKVGYSSFFIIAFILTVPGLLTIIFIPKTPVEFLQAVFAKTKVNVVDKKNYHGRQSPNLCVTFDGQTSPSLMIDVIYKNPQQSIKESLYNFYILIQQCLIKINIYGAEDSLNKLKTKLNTYRKYIAESNRKAYEEKLTNYQTLRIPECWLINLKTSEIFVFSWSSDSEKYQITKFSNEKEHYPSLEASLKSQSALADRLALDLTADQLLLG
jgi:PAT family beta-lactamase induction signal transducer AmpG